MLLEHVPDPDTVPLEPLALIHRTCPAQSLRGTAVATGSVEAVLAAWRKHSG